ncbi:Protein Brevis radix-like 2 [Hirschfeldia incana]|nr:Protein Brevis radix-like 2 [Hirschfeldia incana]KAJ0264018.1 Protein Brevis radix-like 2 [Hirschfeldia incana]
MLTCIACSKQQNTNNGRSKEEEDDDDRVLGTPRSKQAIKSLTSQIKDMAVKASGAYKSCKPCSGSSNRNNHRDSDAAASASGRFHYAYKRPGRSGSSTPKILGKEMESRLKGLLSGEGTPESLSGRTESTVFLEEEDDDEPKEWVAQVEPGVLITFVSLPEGGNDLKRIRFSREMFDKRQAQKWWAENFEKVMELYNVQQFNQQSVPFPTPPTSKDESSTKNGPATPPLNNECPRGKGYASSGSSQAQQPTTQRQNRYPSDSSGLATTPKLSSISGTKTEETLSVVGSARSSGGSSGEEEDAEHSEEVSVSNASENDTEWVEQDEEGVYITIRALPDGTRELRRVRFSRDRFGETDARLWWEKNKARIQQQYL